MNTLKRIDEFLSAATVSRLLRIMLILQVGLTVFFIAGSHDAFVKLPVPTTTDFASFYAAGTLADEGRPAAAYDLQEHRATEERITARGIDYKFFFNPPVFLLICAPLAFLPYLVAFVLFEAATFAAWMAVTLRIAGGGRLTMMGLAAIPSVYWALGWGQNSFLSATLMGLGTLLLDSNPLIAGAAFGALCFKPHFGILIPVALLAAGRYRAIAGAALAVSSLIALSFAVFGEATWLAFLDMATHSRGTIESGRVMFAGHVDPGGAARLLGLAASTGWKIQAAISLATAIAVGLIWRRGARAADANGSGSQEVRSIALVAGTLVAMPFVLFYDLVMAGVAVAWLIRLARRSGFLAGEKTLLAAIFLLDLFAYAVARETPFALGVLVAPALLLLSIRRHLKPGLNTSSAS